MTEISRRIFLHFLLIFFSIFLQFLPGFSDDSDSQKDTKDNDADASSRSLKKMMNLSSNLVFVTDMEM
ncbi:unnamed protein product [Lactuca virosa]|uniref:Uncharacterized protein n=1 Tax=Lactuca virosa TaxID=75947 RepID=A0AAU9P101_9ASTR|nr:unnamed protein product [Lactuca virosa]